MRTFQTDDHGVIRRKVQASLSRFEGKLLETMAKRERITTSEMLRQCVLREACRPLFGEPIHEVVVDAQE